MEGGVGWNKKTKEEEELEMLLNEIPRVTSPQQQQLQDQYHFLRRSGGFTVPPPPPPAVYGGNGRSSYLGHSSTSSLEGSPSMGGTTSGTASPVHESDLLMDDFGLINRLMGVHVSSVGRVPEMKRSGWMSPFGGGGGGGYVVGDSPSSHDLVSDYLETQFSRGYLNHQHHHQHRPIAANPIAAASSQYFSSGGGVRDANMFPYVSSVSQTNGFNSDWDNMYLPGSNPAMMYPEMNSGFAMHGQHVRRLPEEQAAADFKPFACEDSFIIQGKDLRFVQNRGRGLRRERERERFNADELQCPIRPCGSVFRTVKYDSLMDLKGCIYFVAKDQQGCRFLQQKFDERKPEDVEMIFRELIGHVAELMVNPFANYLMQKLFDVCTEEQRLRIILALTERPFDLVQISLNNHGTRAVQRLLETLQTQQQITVVISALQPGFLVLIRDLNGHHVIQRCLQCLSAEYNKFIFDAAAKHCVKIATDQHGCCVLQRCIIRSTGEYRSNLVMQIAANGMFLAHDPYGNYAVQFIMEMNNPLANELLMSQFKDNFVELSRNKFGSNVVEKCLKMWEEARRIIILELLAAPHFDMLLQHQYANYVIQRALSFKGPLRDALVDAIQPHAPVLRTSPYCKKIFSKPYFKRCTSY